jgi:alpha-1,2-mannosyltransferase
MFQTLRTGAWLTRQRLRVYPALLLAAFVIAGLALAATARHGTDVFGHPLGADFTEVWTAGHAVNQGDPARPYDLAAYKRDQDRLFGASDGFYIWPYPPFFLAIAAALALCPYGLAFAVWQGSTLALYLAAIFRALRPARLPARQTLLAALAFPVVFINLTHGQNGFLTAGLLGGALILLPGRPIAAGLCFALLAYKPHLGLLIVPALVAGGCWRTLATGAVGLAAMTLASLAAFGTAPWRGFFAHLDFSRAMLEAGAAGFGKFVSPFAAIRLAGGSVAFAYAGQAVVTASLLAAVIVVWRSKADFRLKAATLIAANLAATPYVFDYDLAVLGAALAFALSYGIDKGFRAYEKSGLALIWIAPLLARPLASGLFVPIGPPVILLFVAGLVLRARADASSPEHPTETLPKAA